MEIGLKLSSSTSVESLTTQKETRFAAPWERTQQNQQDFGMKLEEVAGVLMDELQENHECYYNLERQRFLFETHSRIPMNRWGRERDGVRMERGRERGWQSESPGLEILNISASQHEPRVPTMVNNAKGEKETIKTGSETIGHSSGWPIFRETAHSKERILLLCFLSHKGGGGGGGTGYECKLGQKIEEGKLEQDLDTYTATL